MVDALPPEVSALGAEAAGSVHGRLERLVLPAENVIGVLAEARRVTHREHEGLGAILGPLRLVVEAGSVPVDFVHELRDANGVSIRAVTAKAEESGGTVDRVRNVVLVVGGVEVFAVPAACNRQYFALLENHREGG